MPTGFLQQIEYISNEQIATVMLREPTIEVWDARSGQNLGSFRLRSRVEQMSCCRGNGKLVAAEWLLTMFSSMQYVRILDARTGEQERLDLGSRYLAPFAVSSGCSVLAFTVEQRQRNRGGRVGRVAIYSLREKRFTEAVDISEQAFDLGLSPNGRLLATSGEKVILRELVSVEQKQDN